ncbi:MAG: heme A synthase [Actinomycetales bacterium]|nr:heme A synthase [Actinomycetales bacterium]
MTQPATSPATSGRSLWRRFVDRLPDSPERTSVRVAAWLSWVTQVLIVGTGGLVRLTGSGLGCPTWPRCTADSFVTTPEMGVHGLIEFGNRLLTFVLIAVAIVMFLFVLRYRRERRDLFVLALVLGLGIPAQGVVGGISVLTKLNPYVVGLHFVVSAVLVVLATVLVVRVLEGPGGGPRRVPGWLAGGVAIAAALVAVTVVFGILTTGSGPHAGDENAPRNGLDSELLQHVHSWPAYALLGLTVILLVASVVRRERVLGTRLGLLLAVELVQIAVGLWQARTGLPPFLVGAHMVLACLLVSAMTASVLALRAPRD